MNIDVDKKAVTVITRKGLEFFDEDEIIAIVIKLNTPVLRTDDSMGNTVKLEIEAAVSADVLRSIGVKYHFDHEIIWT